MSMAGDLNVVTLVGRLTRDSEIRYSQKGDAVVCFSIALNRRKRNVDGSWEDEANFFNCVYFGKSAEAINQYLTKGRQVAIFGELRQNRYESDGQTRSTVEIFVNTLQLLGGNQNSGSQPRDSFDSPRQSSYSRPTSQYENKPRSQAPQRGMGSDSVDLLENVDFSGGPENYGDDPIPF